MRQIKEIIIHCSATKEGQEISVDTIREWHLRRGFIDIGYHYVIGLDGVIFDGRPIEEEGAHCKGHNDNSVGICYVGGLDNLGDPKDTRTEAQKKTLEKLIKELCEVYPVESIKGHRDYSTDLNGDGVISKNEWMKSCPCFDAEPEYKHLLK